MLRSLTILALCASFVGCTTNPNAALPNQSQVDREHQIARASNATVTGNYALAEKLMADYLYRGDDGELLLKRLKVGGDYEKQAVDTVALLLWDTKRDRSLMQFANRYLPSEKRTVMLCRLAERNQQFKEAANCWNGLGDLDRSERAMRSEGLLKYLSD